VNQHDEEEFRQFAAARMDDLRGLAYLTCGNWQTAEDAVSTALTRLYVNWKKVVSPHPYACRIVVNAAVDEVRRPWWRRERSADLTTLDRVEPDSSELIGERDRIRRALGRLPAGQRSILVLRFYGDFSVDEVAEMLRRSPGTIKSQSSRGLATLRRLLSVSEAPTVFAFKESETDERYAPVVRYR
jgi:RNA polymerase sigma-70 factor (sigma-E family)